MTKYKAPLFLATTLSLGLFGCGHADFHSVGLTRALIVLELEGHPVPLAAELKSTAGGGRGVGSALGNERSLAKVARRLRRPI